MDWTPNEFSVHSVTSYASNSMRQETDCDGEPAIICTANEYFKGWELSQDLRLSYANGANKGTVGAYYGEDYLSGKNSEVDCIHSLWRSGLSL